MKPAADRQAASASSLPDQETLFRAVASHAIAAIAIVDLQYRFKFANEGMARMFGFASAAELMEVPRSLDLVHPEDAARMRGIGKERLAGEPVPNGYEFRGIRKDGSQIWLTNAARVIEWEGEPAFEFVCIDITDRKRAEQALRESEERYRDLVEGSLQAYYVHRNFKLLFANRAFAELMGYESVEQAMNMPSLLDHAPPEDRDVWVNAYRSRVTGDTISPVLDRVFMTRDRRRVHAHIIARKIKWDGEDAVQATLVDLSDRDRAEEALRASEQRYRDLVDGSLQAICVHREFKLLFANQAMASLLGAESPEALIGAGTLLDFVPAEEHASWRERYRLRLSGKLGQSRVERNFIASGGRRIRAELLAQRIDWRGEPAIQFTLVDITDRKRSEDALRASEERYRELVEGSQQGIVVHRNFKPLFANLAIASMFGFESAGDFLRQDDLLDLLPPERRSAIRELYRARLAGKPAPEHYEAEWIHRDGSHRWLDVESRVVTWEGEPAVQSTMIEITERKRAQQELANSERRYRDLIEASLQGIVVSRDNRILFANQMEADLFGFERPDDMLGIVADTLYTPESNALRWKRRAGLRPGGSLPRVEFEGIRRDGEPVWLESRSREIMWDGVPALMAVHVDISERKRAESALRQSESRYRDLVSLSLLGIVVLHEGDILYANPAAASMFGFSSPDQIVGHDFISLVQPDDAADLIKRREHPIGIPLPVIQVEITRRDNGEKVWIEAQAVNTVWEGKRVKLATYVDITQRKRAEQALREREALLNALLDHAPAVIYVRDREGRFLVANREYQRNSRLRADEILGKRLSDIYPPQLAEQFARHDSDVLHSGQSFNYEESVVRPDRTQEFLTLRFPLLDPSGRVTAICGISTDITGRKRAERAMQASEQRYRDLIEGSLQGMFIHRDFHLLFANRAFAEMLRYPSVESLMALDSLLAVVAPHERERIQSYSGARIRGESAPERFELECVRMDGEPILFEFQSRAVDWEGQRAIQSTVFNITERKRAEQALRDSERRFRELLENSPLGTFVHKDHHFVYVNAAFARMFGYGAAEEIMALGKTEVLVHPDDRARLDEYHAARQRNAAAPDQYEYRGLHKNGSILWVQNHVRRIVWEGQSATQTIAIDVTEPKRAEAALRDSEERYRDVVEGSLQGIYIRTKERIVFANQAMADMLGYPTAAAVVEMGDPTRFTAHSEIPRLTAYGQARLRGESPPTRYESEFVHLDGRHLLVEVQARVVKWHDQDAVQIIVYDITERKRAEQAVEDSRLYLASVLDTALDAIVTVDRYGTIEMFNLAAERIFGYPRGEVIGKNVAMLVPPEHQAGHQGYIEAYLRTGVSTIIGVGREAEALRRGGARFPVSIEVTEVRHRDRITFTAILRDITERKMQEVALVETARAKSAMLSTLSHELRTPLTSILGFAQLIRRDDNLTQVQRDDLGTIEQSSHHLLELINDVLDVQKMEAGFVQLERSPFDLYAMAEALVNMFRPRTTEKQVELRLEIDAEVPHWVHGDARKLRQVLINLLGNAAKFTDQGSIELSLANDGAAHVRFSVRDSGPGIGESELKELMKPFRQFSTTRGGTGLGLAISKGLVEVMGGRLEVRSTLGQGSEFRFTLPLEPQSAAVIEAQQLPEPGSALKSGMRVLIVDDDGRIREWVGRLLRSEGYDVAAAEDGREAIRKFAESPTNLVLMDLRMPIMGGMEAIRRIRKMPGGDKVPIFVLSAEISANEPAPKDPEAPYELALAKPIEAGQLLDAVGAFLMTTPHPSPN